jgi:hypothetical protein
VCQVKARGLVFAALATSDGERICDSPIAQRRPEWTDARSPRCHEQAEDRSGQQELWPAGQDERAHEQAGEGQVRVYASGL